MSEKQRLELTWVGKENRPKLEPRILIEDPEKSYHAAQRHSENDIFDNRLIFGDNLLALKALEQEFAGKIKCIYVDPPFNTQQAFEHYDDGIEHSLWLSLMRDRLEVLWQLLADEGSIWVHLDDNEVHYLKVLMDEVFGRQNFVASCVWEKDKGGRGDADISLSHDQILLYAKERGRWSQISNLMPRTETQLKRFKNPDNDPRGRWRQGDDGTAKSGTEKQKFPVELPSGRIVRPPKGRYWAFAQSTFDKAVEEGRAYFGKDGNRLPIIKRYLSKVRQGVAPRTWWSADEVGTNQGAKRDHLRKLLPDIEPFGTPKPEGLVERAIHISTVPGDLVLDSFLGSGTTAAVAHKMGRRWIGIELGDHCHTHCIPRLKKVINGDDEGGITKAVNWKGGGGFRYYRIGPSLIVNDEWGNPVINPEFNAAMLAEAMCKLEGFDYAPSEDVFWVHGKSTETDSIYVTTQFMSRDMLTRLSDEVGPQRSLLICCSAFRCDPGQFPNLTIKKIPKAVMKKCEWGHDDYSLEIQNLPQAPPEPENQAEDDLTRPHRKFGKSNPAQATMFDVDSEQ